MEASRGRAMIPRAWTSSAAAGRDDAVNAEEGPLDWCGMVSRSWLAQALSDYGYTTKYIQMYMCMPDRVTMRPMC